ncbi:MAG: hypothetical protein ABJC60_07855 [Actinomycetota bacterium]
MLSTVATVLLARARMRRGEASRLIDACRGLSPEQFETSVPGPYGAILDTMRHLVDGDSTYLVWLTGDRSHTVEQDGMGLRDEDRRTRGG